MTQFMPLTDEEQARRNSTDTPEHERIRLYARDLRVTAEAYAKAADAKGLRKDCASYLYAESVRLTVESGLWFDRADELEAREGDEPTDSAGRPIYLREEARDA